MVTILRDNDFSDPASTLKPIEQVELTDFSYYQDHERVFVAYSDVIIYRADLLIKVFKYKSSFPKNLIEPIDRLPAYL